MTNKRQLTYRESAIREKKDETLEWRRVNWTRYHEMIPILDALENQKIPSDIQQSLKNYLVISLVSTMRFSLDLLQSTVLISGILIYQE